MNHHGRKSGLGKAPMTPMPRSGPDRGLKRPTHLSSFSQASQFYPLQKEEHQLIESISEVDSELEKSHHINSAKKIDISLPHSKIQSVQSQRKKKSFLKENLSRVKKKKMWKMNEDTTPSHKKSRSLSKKYQHLEERVEESNEESSKTEKIDFINDQWKKDNLESVFGPPVSERIGGKVVPSDFKSKDIKTLTKLKQKNKKLSSFYASELSSIHMDGGKKMEKKI